MSEVNVNANAQPAANNQTGIIKPIETKDEWSLGKPSTWGWKTYTTGGLLLTGAAVGGWYAYKKLTGNEDTVTETVDSIVEHLL